MRKEYKLSRCISTKEARCHCGKCGQEGMKKTFLECADKFSIMLEDRAKEYVPIYWSSLCRCIPHNKASKGVKDSDHLIGDAGDCLPYNGFNSIITKEVFYEIAKLCFGYVKFYSSGRLHCSARKWQKGN